MNISDKSSDNPKKFVINDCKNAWKKTKPFKYITWRTWMSNNTYKKRKTQNTNHGHLLIHGNWEYHIFTKINKKTDSSLKHNMDVERITERGQVQVHIHKMAKRDKTF